MHIQWVDMSLHSYTLSWFQYNHHLLFLLNAAWLEEKPKISFFLVFGLTWPELEPSMHRTRGEHANHYTTEAGGFVKKTGLRTINLASRKVTLEITLIGHYQMFWFPQENTWGSCKMVSKNVGSNTAIPYKLGIVADFVLRERNGFDNKYS